MQRTHNLDTYNKDFYFCLRADEDGCYLSFSDVPSKWKKIDPERITDDDVRKWFDHLSKIVAHPMYLSSFDCREPNHG